MMVYCTICSVQLPEEMMTQVERKLFPPWPPANLCPKCHELYAPPKPLLGPALGPQQEHNMLQTLNKHPECRVTKCYTPIREDKVFCDPHWEKLNPEVKDRMIESYQVEKQTRGLPNPSWDMALQQAINFLSR